MQCREKYFYIFSHFCCVFGGRLYSLLCFYFLLPDKKIQSLGIFLQGGFKNDFKGVLKCFKVFLSVLSVGFYQSLSLQFFGFSVVVCFFSFFILVILQQVIVGLHGQDINQSYGFLFWEKKKESRKKGKFSPGRARFCLDHLTRGDGNNKKSGIFFNLPNLFLSCIFFCFAHNSSGRKKRSCF